MNESLTRRIKIPNQTDPSEIESDPPPRSGLMKAQTVAMAVLELAGYAPTPVARVVPWSRDVTALKSGTPRHYATALTRDGLANGVVVTTIGGRPVHIEGNPDHPFTRGGTDAFLQAALLQLYDMDRSAEVRQSGRASTWDAANAAIQPQLAKLRAKGGEGLALLTGPISSPSMIAQIEALQAAMPRMRWYQHAPVGRDAIYDGTRLAFGAPLEVRYCLDRARFVVALDGDVLDPGPHQAAYANAWTESHRATERRGEMATLIAAAVTPTLTSAKADLRIGVSQSELRMLASALERAVQTGITPDDLAPDMAAWVTGAAFGLRRFGRDAVVVVGAYQPAALHALAHRINAQIGATDSTVLYHAPSLASAHPLTGDIVQLVVAMRAGQVRGLIVLGANPVYDAPADLDFAGALIRVDLTIHANQYFDETAVQCRWHFPLAHELECWGDARALDGTVSLIQPLVKPIFGGLSATEILSRLANASPATDLDLLRRYWRDQLTPPFEAAWRDTLLWGFMRDSAAPTVAPRLAEHAAAPSSNRAPARPDRLELLIRPDAMVWDGSAANNVWLQAQPKPLTRLVRENAILISPMLAAERSIANGDEIEIATATSAIMRGPAWILSDQPSRSVTVHLGYGRTRAGKTANGIGHDAYRLRRHRSLWSSDGIIIRKTGRKVNLSRALERPLSSAVLASRAENPPPIVYGTEKPGPRTWGRIASLESRFETALPAARFDGEGPDAAYAQHSNDA
jgi:molybdopterin-containing oxidoreductase family iron-sulfur binding subunit